MRKQQQKPQRSPRWQEAMALARTPAERLAVAHDRLRADLRSLGRAQRDPVMARRDRDMADAIAEEAVAFLNSLCERIGERKAMISR